MTNAISHRSLLLTAIVAGLYSLVVAVLLVIDAANRVTDVPLESPEYVALKELLSQDPGNEKVRQEIRSLDLKLRREYFRERDFTKTGALLLLVGVGVMLFMARWAAALRRRLPMPTARAAGPDIDERLSQIGLRAVLVLVVVLFGTALILRATQRSALPATRDELLALLQPTAAQTVVDILPQAPVAPAPGPAVPQLPSPEEYARNWPRFRGPDGSGISPHKDIPTQWDGKTGQGILWKTKVPLPGVNSPIVWNDRVFLAGADEKRREVYCVDAADGKILWNKPISASTANEQEPLKVSESTGYAAPTMATDGRFVFALFATGDLAALDMQGNELWRHSFGIAKNAYGHASSLAVDRDRLIVQFDQGRVREGLSKLYAFDGATGKPVWEAQRPVSTSWSTPIVIEHEDQPTVVACADPWVIAYAADTGAELWRAKCLENAEVGPSPVYSDGLVFAGNDNALFAAIRAGGKGDVTESHMPWTTDFGVPDTCSPLVAGDLALLLTSYGTLAAYDKNKGGEEPLWEEDLGTDFTSSPGLVGKHVYLFDNEGKCHIVEPTRKECKLIGEAELGEKCVTSPAFQDGRIYIRGKEHLFCIGRPAAKPTDKPAPAVTAASGPQLPTPEEYRQSWPRFRGHDGSGVTTHKNIPTQWDGATGKGIAWKTPIPLPGLNSPIVWKDRVFLAGADEKSREVYCIGTTDGKILWNKPVSTSTADAKEPLKVSESTGYAAPTMATDGRFVFALFATGDLAALDMQGEERWRHSFGIAKNAYGHASSLAVYRDRLIVQFDQGRAREGLAKLYAFDGATGKPVWEVKRPVSTSWSTPIVIEHEGQPTIITCADPWVIAYAPDTGTELWRAKCLENAEVGPSPVYADGLVFAGNDNALFAAIRAGGKGDVTESHMPWTTDFGVPDTCSPLVAGELVLLLASYGTLSAYDKNKGGEEPLWEEDLGTDFNSSPSLVGKQVYLFDREGKCRIVEPTREKCKLFGEAELGEECDTSPAFQDGRIYIRGKEHLFCIGN